MVAARERSARTTSARRGGARPDGARSKPKASTEVSISGGNLRSCECSAPKCAVKRTRRRSRGRRRGAHPFYNARHSFIRLVTDDPRLARLTDEAAARRRSSAAAAAPVGRAVRSLCRAGDAARGGRRGRRRECRAGGASVPRSARPRRGGGDARLEQRGLPGGRARDRRGARGARLAAAPRGDGDAGGRGRHPHAARRRLVGGGRGRRGAVQPGARRRRHRRQVRPRRGVPAQEGQVVDDVRDQRAILAQILRNSAQFSDTSSSSAGAPSLRRGASATRSASNAWSSSTPTRCRSRRSTR